MDFKHTIWIVVILYCIVSVICNETVQLKSRCKSENFGANGYKLLHDFNFPDVTYPTTALESCQPFYFNFNSLDAIVGPFSSDVQSNYRSLLSPNENKIKDVTTKKSVVDDNIQYQTSTSNVLIDNNNNKSDDSNALEVARELFENYIAKNHIDSELKEILALLFGDYVKESKSSEIHKIGSEIKWPVTVPLKDEMIASNLTKNKSSEETIAESVEEFIVRQSKPHIINSVIEELIQFLAKRLDNNTLTNDSNERITNEIITEYIPKSTNIINKDTIVPMQPISDERNNHNISSNIQLELELTKEDIEYVLLNSTNYDVTNISIDALNNVGTFISKNFEIEPFNNLNDKNLVQEPTVLSKIELNYTNFNSSVLNEQFELSQLEPDQFNKGSGIYEIVNEPIYSNNLTVEENIQDIINTDDSNFYGPKEPMVFDVVYRDAYNLEKPVLDIVPSSIPVRLKINIEIVKQDSNEIDDFYKTDFNKELFAPRIYEKNINSRNLNNSIESTEEDLATEEQITVLDEINESDFINALSILLLDSLNNNPIEIMPTEFINSENNSCNILMEYSEEPLHDSLMNYIDLTNNHNEETQPITGTKLTHHIDCNKEQSLEIDSNSVKYNTTSPLIEILRSVITADQQEDDHKNNITDILEAEMLQFNDNNEDIDKLNNISLENKNFNGTGDIFSLHKACNFESFTETENKVSPSIISNATDKDTQWPLIDVFQLKISPTEVDLSNKVNLND